MLEKNLGQGKNDYGDGSILHGPFHAPKTKLCYIKDKYGRLIEKKTFKVYQNSERLLETYKYFKLKDGESVIGQFPPPWKKSPARGITIDQKETTIKEYKSNLNE